MAHAVAGGGGRTVGFSPGSFALRFQGLSLALGPCVYCSAFPKILWAARSPGNKLLFCYVEPNWPLLATKESSGSKARQLWFQPLMSHLLACVLKEYIFFSLIQVPHQ